MEEQKESFWRRHRWLLWLAGAAVVAVAAAGVALGVAARRFEPYLRARIVAGMEDRFHAHVEMDDFHVQVKNVGQALRTGEWGIWATGKGLRIWPPTAVNGEQELENSSAAPLISLGDFSFHVPMRLEKMKEIRIGEVDLDGLHIRVPPRSQRPKLVAPAGTTTSTTGNAGPTVLIQRIVCTNADLLLETDKPGKLPNEFAIPHLTLTNVTPGGAMGYVADVLNPKPKGMIHAEGSFGPWLTVDPGMSLISGKYHMDKNDMSVFRGIAGIITSDGTYKGTLRFMSVVGTATVPDFRLTKFNNPVPLVTGFSARVDGTTGDTLLDQVNATLGHSQFTTNGQIVRVKLDGKTGEATLTQPAPTPAKPAAGKTAPAVQPVKSASGHNIDLNINIAHGQIDDFLKLASKSQTPLLTGAVAVKAHLLIPPGKVGVEQRMKLDGTFSLTGTRFTSDKIQGKIQQLSLRGQGRPEDLKTEDPTLVRSEMHGDFHMAKAVIALPNLGYSVPGADIQLKGSYALEGALNFTGTARLQATVSQMVTGWKSLLLKPVDNYFKKDGAGTLVPITIKGTREAPNFGVDFSRMGFKGTKAESPASKQ